MDLKLSRKRIIGALTAACLLPALAGAAFLWQGDIEISRMLWLEHHGLPSLVEKGKPAISEWRPLARAVSNQHFWVFRVMMLYAAVCLLVGRGDPSLRVHRRLLLLSTIAALIMVAMLGNWFMKFLIGRPRPYTLLFDFVHGTMNPDYHSFPSGHTLETFSYIAPLVYYYRSRLLRGALIAAGIGLSLLRVVLAYHYLSDVLLSAGLGLAAGLLISRYIERTRSHRVQA